MPSFYIQSVNQSIQVPPEPEKSVFCVKDERLWIKHKQTMALLGQVESLLQHLHLTSMPTNTTNYMPITMASLAWTQASLICRS